MPPDQEASARREPPDLANLRRLTSVPDLANVLGIPAQNLTYIIYRSNPAGRYSRFTIAKRSGAQRTILAPHPALRRLQTRLNCLLLACYQPKPSVHSFVRGRSIHSNAAFHVRRRHV